MPSLLSLHHITKIFPIGKKYTGEPVFKDVGLQIEKGKTLGIMGKSGVGKTTLGKIITGLESPTTGEVKFQGRNINELNSRQFRDYRSQVQMMFQDPESALNPKKSIFRILNDCRALTRLPPGDHDRLIRKSFARVGLPIDLLRYFPWQLSGGINQRVALARILMVKPRVIVLDEPTSALDLSIQAQILRLLKKLQQETGISYVFISHDEAVVRWMSHRIGLLNHSHLTITQNHDQ
jgi:peptide/nickel transport system ATP-binding protein